MNYKQLVSTLKKKYSDKLDLNKVFSEKFEDKQAALNNLDEEKIVNKLMRGSHIEGKNYQNNE